MFYAVNKLEMKALFERREDFYDNTFEKVAIALLFAVTESSVIALVRGNSK